MTAYKLYWMLNGMETLLIGTHFDTWWNTTKFTEGRMKCKPTSGRITLQKVHGLIKGDGCTALKRAAEERKRWRYSEMMSEDQKKNNANYKNCKLLTTSKLTATDVIGTISLTYIRFLEKAKSFIGRVDKTCQQFLLLTFPLRLHAVPLTLRCLTERLHIYITHILTCSVHKLKNKQI